MTRIQLLDAARLWLLDFNTADIASALFLFESDVERNIEDIKREARLMKVRAA